MSDPLTDQLNNIQQSLTRQTEQAKAVVSASITAQQQKEQINKINEALAKGKLHQRRPHTPHVHHQKHMQRKSSGDSTEFAKEFEDKLAMSGPASMDVDESIDEEKPEDHQLDEEYAEPDSIDVEEEEHVTYSSPQVVLNNSPTPGVQSMVPSTPNPSEKKQITAPKKIYKTASRTTPTKKRASKRKYEDVPTVPKGVYDGDLEATGAEIKQMVKSIIEKKQEEEKYGEPKQLSELEQLLADEPKDEKHVPSSTPEAIAKDMVILLSRMKGKQVHGQEICLSDQGISRRYNTMKAKIELKYQYNETELWVHRADLKYLKLRTSLKLLQKQREKEEEQDYLISVMHQIAKTTKSDSYLYEDRMEILRERALRMLTSNKRRRLIGEDDDGDDDYAGEE